MDHSPTKCCLLGHPRPNERRNPCIRRERSDTMTFQALIDGNLVDHIDMYKNVKYA